MEAFHLVINLLEKVSVLVALALVLLMLRPAEVWLGETGARASVRRRVFLVLLLSGLAIWGTFLGFEIDGVQSNIRMVGIIVAGYLGGAWVGLSVGAAAGGIYALEVSPEMAPYVFAASVFNGVVAGLWSRQWGTAFLSIAVGAFVIQGLHHVGVGLAMALVDWEMAVSHGSHLTLHAAKITANSVGVILFMGLLSLVRELEAARRDASASRAAARSARLEALQYQLQPHFLFNLLNTLAYLIRTKPARARELTLDLADFLRYTLDRDGEDTTLRDELSQLERYVDLERARFGDGLCFSVDLGDDEAVAEVAVPPLILQPLVENALRHGSRDGRVEVKIDVQRQGDEVLIAVLDDGPGPDGQADSGDDMAMRRRSGVGLANVRERLSRFYHGHAQLRLSAREDRPGACALIRLPLGDKHRQGAGLADQARQKLRDAITYEADRS